MTYQLTQMVDGVTKVRLTFDPALMGIHPSVAHSMCHAAEALKPLIHGGVWACGVAV